MFSQWVISVVGIVLLSILADIILPHGQTNKYIKNIFAIITVFVIVTPLPSLFKNISYQGDLIIQQETPVVDENFLNQLAISKQVEQEVFLENVFEENGYSNIHPDIRILFEEGIYKIDLIEINIKNAVIRDEDKNINIKENLLKLIVDACDVSKDKVVFYE